MQKKKYTYEYQEQIEIAKGLKYGDIKIIAEKTGYSMPVVSQMCSGIRKMNDSVKKVVEQLVLINKQIDNIAVEQRELKNAE